VFHQKHGGKSYQFIVQSALLKLENVEIFLINLLKLLFGFIIKIAQVFDILGNKRLSKEYSSKRSGVSLNIGYVRILLYPCTFFNLHDRSSSIPSQVLNLNQFCIKSWRLKKFPGSYLGKTPVELILNHTLLGWVSHKSDNFYHPLKRTLRIWKFQHHAFGIYLPYFWGFLNSSN